MNEFSKNSKQFSLKKTSNFQLFEQYGNRATQLFKSNKHKECKSILIILFSLIKKESSLPPKEIAVFLHYWTCILYLENKLEESLLQADVNFLHFTEIQQQGLLTKTLILKSAILYKQGDFQKCIVESNKVIDYIFETGEEVQAIKPLNNLAASYFCLNQLYKSVSAFYRALEVCKKHKVYNDIPVLQYNIIIILLNQERYKTVALEIEKFQESIGRFNLGKQGNLYLKICQCNFYNATKKYDWVLNCAEEIEAFPNIEKPFLYNQLYICKIEALIKLERYEEAFNLLTNKIKQSEELGIKFSSTIYKKFLSILLGNPEKQSQYLSHPIFQAQFNGKIGNLITFLEASIDQITQISERGHLYKLIAQYYQSINDHKRENGYLRKLIEVNNKLYKVKKNDQVLRLQEEYQSEQKQQEIVFQRQLVEEQKVINVKLDKFAQITAHDLKEPLRGIYSFSRILKNKTYPLLEKKDQESWDFIIDASLRMEALIKDILAFSKMGTNLPPPNLIDLNNLMEKVMLNLKGKIMNSNGQVLYSQLPSIMGHEVLFLQLFQNLIGNALKFVPPERSPMVKIEIELQENYHQISIGDNGIGIPTDKLERVFDAFTRLNKKGQFEGSGLGLATCKKIVETYNGKIWLESQLNKGTTFYFQLPIEQS